MTNNPCEVLCKEIHDSLGNSRLLVRVFKGRLTRNECQKIRETYMEMYGEDLFDLLRDKVDVHKTSLGRSSETTCMVLASLVLSPHERDAFVAKDAIFKQRDWVSYKALIEIYGGRKSSHFFLIQQAYQSKFRTHLDQDIMGIEPPHSYQKMLMALGASQKAHNTEISLPIAKCDAQRLFLTGETKSLVLEILSKRSIPQLKLTFSMYKHIYGHSYVKHFKNRYDDEFEDALKTVVKLICDPPKYYAKALAATFKGNITDEGDLERIVMSQTETEMNEIRKIYKNKYGLELIDAILESIQAGSFRDLIVSLITKN